MNEIQEVAYQYDGMTDERIDELIVTYTNGVISAVPMEIGNKDYNQVLKWVENGGEIDE
jgi:ribonuclease HIII